MQLIFVDSVRMEQVYVFLFPCFSFISILAVLTKNTIVARRLIKETEYTVCLLYVRLAALNAVLACRGGCMA